jgi:Fic family protein
MVGEVNARGADLRPEKTVSPGGSGPHLRAARFLTWFEKREGEGLIRAGLAHLWFVTLHPFDDGNGRIARALTDMALAQLEGRAERYYSVASQLKRERKAYYDVLERAQRATPDVTDWLLWFIGCFERAIDSADVILDDVLRRAAYAKRLTQARLNERQRSVLIRLLGLEGNLTAKRWATMARTSADTAQRDLRELVELRLLVKNPGGSKNTSYSLKL